MGASLCQAADTSQSVKVVETVKVKRQPINHQIRLIGTVRAKRESLYSAKVNGHLDIHILAGAFVSKGTLFAEIENVDLQKQYTLASETASIAKTQYERAQTLQKSHSVSQQAVEQKHVAWLEAEDKMLSAKRELDKTQLTASFDGVLGAYKIREGAYLKEGDPIISLYDPKQRVIELDIPEGVLNQIPLQPKAVIGDQLIPLSQFQKIIDPETHMAFGLVELPETIQDNFIIGTTIDVELVIQESPNALVIPYEAVFIKDEKPYVYRLKDNKAKLTPIKLGVRSKEEIEISEGLQENEEVIARGQDRLYDDIEVKVSSPLPNKG